MLDRPAGLQFASAGQTRHPAAMQTALEAFSNAGDDILDPGTDEEPIDDEAESQGDESKPLFLRHDFDENLAMHLTDSELCALASDLQRGIDSDLHDRADWDAISAKLVEYLGLKVLQGSGGSSEVGGGSALAEIWDPLLLEASVSFWANAVAEFLPADGPCKVRDDEPPAVAVAPAAAAPGMGHNGGPTLDEAPAPSPPQVTRADLAQAFEKDMNHYLTKGDKSYYPDFSRMLFALGPTGTQFRGIYWCPFRNKPVSEWVRAQNLIVSSEAMSLETASRVTRLVKISQPQAKRLMRSGWWRQCALMTPQEDQTETDRQIGEAEGVQRNPLPEDHQHTIQECYTELDLPGFEHTDEDGEMTGQPLPYRVAIDKTSQQIVEIRRNWREDDPLFLARQRFVMFGLIPGLGFYFMGFMHILGNGQLALTTLGRQLLDAGQFANFPAVLAAKGFGRQINTDLNIEPGQACEIDIGNKNIRDVVMEMPFKEPSQVLAGMVGSLTDRLQKLAGAATVPVGEGTADVPVGTIIAMIEQGTKVMAAVHKGIHAARAQELELLRELIAEDPGVLARHNKRPARQWETAEEFRDLDLVPSSDPNVHSQLLRIMQAAATAQLAMQAPGVLDPKWVMKDVMRTIGKELPDEAFMPPAPPQQGPPQDPAKMMAAQAQMLKAQTDAQKAHSDAQTQATETQRKAAEAVTQSQNDQQAAAIDANLKTREMDSKERIAGVQEATEHLRLAAEIAKESHAAKLADQQHGLQVQQHQHQRAMGAGIAGVAGGNQGPVQ